LEGGEDLPGVGSYEASIPKILNDPFPVVLLFLRVVEKVFPNLEITVVAHGAGQGERTGSVVHLVK